MRTPEIFQMVKPVQLLCLLVCILAAAILTQESCAQTARPRSKLGVIVPLSGLAGSMGASLEGALRLAAAANVELIFEDDQCEAKKALAAWHKLTREGVRVFYLACSGSILALAPLAKAEGNLILTSYAGSAEIRKTGTEVIRFNPDALSVADAMKEYFESHPVQNVGLLYEEQDYAVSLANVLGDSLGARIKVRESYPATDTSFKSILTRYLRGDLETLIYIPVGDTAARIVLKELRELGFSKPVIGDVNLCDYPFKLTDFKLSGLCFSARFENPAYFQFEKSYKERFGRISQYPFYDAIAFDVVRILDQYAASDEFRSASGVASLKAHILAGVSGEMAEYSFTPEGEVSGGWRYLRVQKAGE